MYQPAKNTYQNDSTYTDTLIVLINNSASCVLPRTLAGETGGNGI